MPGCVFREHDRYRDARRAHEECLRAHPDAPGACEALRVERDARYEEYETRAQRDWGCENTAERCLLQHGPGPR